jgi:hypothetical protein
MERGLDWLAEQKRLREEYVEQAAKGRDQHKSYVYTQNLKAHQYRSAADELGQANQILLQMGISDQIPINESTIKQHIMSGRTLADQIVREAELQAQEALTKERVNIVENLLKAGTITTEDSPFLVDKAVAIARAEGKYEQAFKEGDINALDYWDRERKLLKGEGIRPEAESPYFAPKTRAWLSDRAASLADFLGLEGTAERMRSEAELFRSSTIPEEYQLPKEGVDIGDGFTVMPDYTMWKDGEIVARIDYETQDIIATSPSWGKQVRSFFDEVWKSIPLNPYYWMSPEQQQLVDYKNKLVEWAENQGIENPEQWGNDVFEQESYIQVQRGVRCLLESG